MKFTISKASDSRFRSEIELNSLEELIEWIKSSDERIIVGDDLSLFIYDDYIE